MSHAKARKSHSVSLFAPKRFECRFVVGVDSALYCIRKNQQKNECTKQRRNCVDDTTPNHFTKKGGNQKKKNRTFEKKKENERKAFRPVLCLFLDEKATIQFCDNGKCVASNKHSDELHRYYIENIASQSRPFQSQKGEKRPKRNVCNASMEVCQVAQFDR